MYTVDYEFGINVSGGDEMSTEIGLLVDLFGYQSIRGEINPEVEWKRQSQILADRFAEKLGLSAQEYINTLPEFRPQPKEFKSTLNMPVVPVIVETRIALSEMLGIVGIDPFFDPSEIKDWTEGGFETPSKPYATWLTYIPGKSVEEVRVNLGKDQRGGTVLDGIALCLRDPRILSRYSLDCPGSQVDPDTAPFLSAFSNSVKNSLPRPFLSCGDVELESPKYASVIASRI